jgi:hypothetical protein
MAVVTITAVLVFSTVLGVVEIPKMLHDKQYRELVTFSILLVLGTALAILKSLDVEIPNPSDLIVWLYSPVSNVMKGLLE